MAASALVHGGRRVLLKHHKFNTGTELAPPNGRSALEEALEARVEVIEFDVARLADGTFALLHDDRLEGETDGFGPVEAADAARLASLRLRGSRETPATLPEIVERLRAHAAPVKVQVDLKEAHPFDRDHAASLLDALAPLRGNDHLHLVVGCLADWNLRLLRRMDAELAVGFDPAFYLRGATASLQMPFPTRVNAYGYVDDHPLGHHRVMPVRDYLRDRMEALAGQLPGMEEAYLHKGFVIQALKDDFNPVAYLQEQFGIFVDVWTLNDGDPGLEEELRLVLEAGADQITTDTAIALAARVADPAP